MGYKYAPIIAPTPLLTAIRYCFVLYFFHGPGSEVGARTGASVGPGIGAGVGTNTGAGVGTDTGAGEVVDPGKMGVGRLKYSGREEAFIRD